MERWEGIVRPYSDADVKSIRGNFHEEHTYAKKTAEKFWKMLNDKEPVMALGAYTAAQAVNMAQAGLKNIYLSGWMCAAENNLADETFPDLSLYPSNSVPAVIRKIKKGLLRADQIAAIAGDNSIDYVLPIVADMEAGHGGVLNTFELTKQMIEAGAACLHLEEQLTSEKRCGHQGSKVIIPTCEFIRKLIAVRLAADVCQTETVIIGRIDSEGAKYITSDIDPYDAEFIEQGERTTEGYYKLKGTPLERCISRAIAYAPYCDLIWVETSTPDLKFAKAIAKGLHFRFPGKLLAWNHSPSFNWKKNLSDEEIANIHIELFKNNFAFQFITLASYHQTSYGIFDLAKKYKEKGMSGYVELQEKEFEAQKIGYKAVKHQLASGAGVFDRIKEIIYEGNSSTLSLKGSTEDEQF